MGVVVLASLVNRAIDVERRFSDLEMRLAAAADKGDADQMRRLAKEHADMAPVIEAARRVTAITRELSDLTEMLTQPDLDPELRRMAIENENELGASVPEIEDEFKRRLLPPDPRDGKNVLVEIRAGTGGDEAALFAGVLFKMYSKYAELRHFHLELISANRTELGGYKEIVFSVEGDRVYSRLKYEGGVHRVQRVPETEAQGRIHTSAATVAILPEPDEVDIEINPNDLRVDVFRSQGPGGQSVNTTDSAVRITHLPSGLVVSCQDEKSQLKNKHKALRVLRARLKELEEEKARLERDTARRSMIGSGDRSQRIRTYNFPQGRITDHRIGLTLYALEEIADGNLDAMIEPLALADERMRLEADGIGVGGGSPAATSAS